jgi:Rieske Fe-S protein
MAMWRCTLPVKRRRFDEVPSRVSDSSARLSRRRLLVLGSTGVGVACSSDPLPSTGDASDIGVSDRAPDARKKPDEPFLGLDGGIANPEPLGWRAPPGGVEVGAVSDFPVGTWRLNAGARAIVARDAMGLYAYSALCTHERCLLDEPDAMGVAECACHGSRFDGVGRPIAPPATVPLRHLAVRVAGGRVYIDPNERVLDTSTRVPVSDGDAGAFDGPRDATADVTRDRPDIDPCTLGVDVGAVSAFAVGTWTLLRDNNLIVGRDAMGLFAYSARCPHQDCTVRPPEATGVTTCPCHGSRFDGNGRVVQGPASTELENFRVRVCAGRVRVDLATPVAPGTRAPVT